MFLRGGVQCTCTFRIISSVPRLIQRVTNGLLDMSKTGSAQVLGIWSMARAVI